MNKKKKKKKKKKNNNNNNNNHHPMIHHRVPHRSRRHAESASPRLSLANLLIIDVILL